ncbi:AAA family ATPase [Aquidulcibacter sp.]|uniref:AAA family ATPase n=1 Tax=Aquidulcibacter sp. TaxID=2052990 RepID=UPI0025BCFFB2|nr:AAA family ATPase [Aquidulcibacter sp.]MCA3693515.1 ATP-binding protein [Aquidulcibacter sp.]
MSKIAFNYALGHFNPGTIELDLSSRINTFVGINNIGKSQLVRQAVAFIGQNYLFQSTGTVSSTFEVSSKIINELLRQTNAHIFDLMSAFSKKEQEIPFNATIIKYSNLTTNPKTNISSHYSMENGDSVPYGLDHYFFENFFYAKSFEKPVFIAAERDFQTAPGWSGHQKPAYQENGSNVQQAYDFLHRAVATGRQINQTILRQLNQVLAPDFAFTEIWPDTAEGSPVLKLGLGDAKYRRIDELGSGIKTVLHALLVLNAYHEIWENIPSCIVIEEIENNLHPRAIRRLIDILVKESAHAETRLIFITHSPVVMEHLASVHDATTHHVYREGDATVCRPIQHFKDACNALTDLGARASDLLQANFVIWAEGPTEQIVIPHLISKYAEDLAFGTDYIVALYGGNLLLHFSGDMPEFTKSDENMSDDIGDHRIEVARLNRNFAFVMDSDGEVEGKPPKRAKEAIRQAQKDGLKFPVWTTYCREIEGMYPIEIFTKVYGLPRNASALAERDHTWGASDILAAGWGIEKGRQIKKIELAKEAIRLGFELNYEEDISALNEIIDAIRHAKSL